MKGPAVTIQTRADGTIPFLSALALIVLLLVLALSSYVELRDAKSEMGQLGALVSALRQPDPAVLPEALSALTETVRIALLGTAMGVAFALGLAWTAARRVAPRWLHRILRAALHFFAAIPPLFSGLLLVIALGPGSLAGVLALALFATAKLALSYADVMDAADRGPVRALERAGAGWFLQQRFGIWPQIAPDIACCTALRLHGALREALMLGLVGAGGIGTTVLLHAASGLFEQVSMLMLVIIATVLAVDLLKSVTLRSIG